jgi:nitrite reductase/ring-hydroxylating ferredoxin subunit
MKVVTQPVKDINMLLVSDKKYFVNQTEYHTQVLPAVCPHRQGPLHYGTLSADGRSIVCPWHENKHSICNLEKLALPSVITGGMLHVVMPQDATVHVWHEHLPVEVRGVTHEA